MSRPNQVRALVSPAGVVFLALAVYLGVVLVNAGGDPLALVRIGARYQVEGAVDPEGYDGQFVYFIARDPAPESVAAYLDVPAYRYQRILMPLLARMLSFGRVEALPWVLVGIGMVAQVLGTILVQRLLVQRGVSRWFALVYGLWAGLLLAVRLGLPEPLAYALVAAGILLEDKKGTAAWMLFGLAVFAKEVALLFVVGKLLVDAAERRWGRFLGLASFTLLPYALFQVWLALQFGEPGIGSGGAMATGFEWIPFMGWLRIGQFSVLLLLAFGAIIVPLFYAPAVWGLWVSARKLLKRRYRPETGYLFMNALVIPFLPFSTVREPGGIFRFGAGFVLAFLLYNARNRGRRALIFSFVWLALMAVVFAEIL